VTASPLQNFISSYHKLTFRLPQEAQTRSFTAAGPRVWNALPSHLRRNMNYKNFKHAL